MLKEIKRHIEINIKEILVVIAIAAGISLVAQVIVGIAVSSSDESATIGTVIFRIIAVLYTFLFCMTNLGANFSVALKMGALRKQYIPASFVFSVLMGLVLNIAAELWRYVDAILVGLKWSNVDVNISISPVWTILIVFLSAAFGSWAGAFTIRSSKWNKVVVISIMLIPTWGFSLVSSGISEKRTDWWGRFCKDALAVFSGVNIWIIIAALFALSIAIAVHSWYLLRKVAVPA